MGTGKRKRSPEAKANRIVREYRRQDRAKKNRKLNTPDREDASARRFSRRGTALDRKDVGPQGAGDKQATETAAPAGSVAGTSFNPNYKKKKAKKVSDPKRDLKDASARDEGKGTERLPVREGAVPEPKPITAMGPEERKRMTLPYDLSKEGVPKIAEGESAPRPVSRPGQEISAAAPREPREVLCPGQNHMVSPAAIVDVRHPQTQLPLCADCAGVSDPKPSDRGALAKSSSDMTWEESGQKIESGIRAADERLSQFEQVVSKRAKRQKAGKPVNLPDGGQGSEYPK